MGGIRRHAAKDTKHNLKKNTYLSVERAQRIKCLLSKPKT